MSTCHEVSHTYTTTEVRTTLGSNPLLVTLAIDLGDHKIMNERPRGHLRASFDPDGFNDVTRKGNGVCMY